MDETLRRILSIGLATSGVCAHASGATEASLTAEQTARVRETLPRLSLNAEREWTAAENRYLEFYELKPAGAGHCFGFLPVESRRIAVHVFVPPDARGSVLLVHHAGVMNRLIHDLLRQGYAVLVYDQPGHGLSDGARATVGDFAEYVAVLRHMAQFTTAQLPGPAHLVAHSMGCAITMDYLLNHTGIAFRRVVLMAPLIHSAHWDLSGFGNRIAGKLVKTIPRVFRKNSSDPEFLAFTRRDPLQTRAVPLAWVRALGEWNERFEHYPASAREVLVIQGDRDTTVDWQYNLRALSGKFPRATVRELKGAGHQLMNEAPLPRARVFGLIREHLEPDS